ncbi:MAG: amidohydrolase family protein [Planctomycetota bacterium]
MVGRKTSERGRAEWRGGADIRILAGLLGLAPALAARSGPPPPPEGRAGPGLAIHGAKILTVDDADRILDGGTVLVRGGKIEYVGERIAPPEGYEVIDLPGAWVHPGLIDIHSHIVGTGDINDMVMPVNPELSIRPSYRPSNPEMRLACAAGVTLIFGIPGSGTSIGGFGGLYKTKTDARYEETEYRDPGGMKSAFNFNPQRQMGDLGTSACGMAWTVERVNDRALAARRAGRDDPALRNLIRVLEKDLPVLVHCASGEGVAGTVRLWKLGYDTACIVSHGDWDGHRVGYYPAQHGVPVNHGPRIMNFTTMVREEKIVGTSQSFVAQGVPNFSLHTDAPVIPQEELFLQGAMSARLGADSYQMLRAITANTAKTFRIYDRVGSLEPGKDADIVISTGDPLDPRSRVEHVLIDGELQYSRLRDGQWF